MFLVIRKRQLILAAAALILAAGTFFVPEKLAQVFAPEPKQQTVRLIIDAGHGGEDGGAVAADGTVESRINLDIALRLEDVMAFLGKASDMTRREDVSVYTEGAETLRQKKVSDLKNRVAQINAVPEGRLISIHQNSMPSSPGVRGAQAFFNTVPGSDSLAGEVQNSLNQAVNERGKTAKKIPDTIYLMKHVTCPAVIVECGFLSNVGEAALLQSRDHQLKLAAAIAAGYQRYLTSEETT